MKSQSKDQLIECFKPVFKQGGFKKIRTNWRKSTDDLILVLNVQSSQWDKADYYINVGIYIKMLGTEKNPPEYRCHIRNRIDESDKSCSLICNEILERFESHDSIQKIKFLWSQNNLPHSTTLDAKKYLEEII